MSSPGTDLEGAHAALPIEISIIVVTYNSAGCINPFLKSLRQYPPTRPWELIVSDNASSDGGPQEISGRFPAGRLIASGVNRGFATAVNEAARMAKGKYYLLANPDVSWEGPVIDHLRAFLDSHPRAAAVCPRLIYPDGRPQPSTRRFPIHSNIWFSRQSPLGHIAQSGTRSTTYTLADPQQPSPVEAAAATFLLVRAPAFHEVGGMDSRYFLYVEDTDLCRRWHDAGWEVWIDPFVAVTHAWASRMSVNRSLRRHHREGIRRYFRTHYPNQRVRNAIVFGALGLSGVLDAVFGRWRQRGARLP